MKEITKAWLWYAERDLKACQEMCSRQDLTNIAAFHAQQCVEKSLKALIEEKGHTVPKIHNLSKLYKKVNSIYENSQLELDESMLDLIDDLYIDTRYPVDLGMLPSGMPSIETATKMCQFAEEVYNKVKKLLENRVA